MSEPRSLDRKRKQRLCVLACQLTTRHGLPGRPVEMVRPAACQVLAALCAGDRNTGEVAERLQLSPNTVWQRLRQMRLTYAQGDLVIFPEGKRSERPTGAGGSVGNTALALSPQGERIAVKWAQRQLEAIEETIRDLRYGDFFEERSE